MLTQESAEIVALRALSWLAGDEDLLAVFMNATGSAQEDLRRGADSPEFLAAVLDFITMDDAWIVRFCDASGLGYEQPMQARALLPGGAAINWT